MLTSMFTVSEVFLTLDSPCGGSIGENNQTLTLTLSLTLNVTLSLSYLVEFF